MHHEGCNSQARSSYIRESLTEGTLLQDRVRREKKGQEIINRTGVRKRKYKICEDRDRESNDPYPTACFVEQFYASYNPFPDKQHGKEVQLREMGSSDTTQVTKLNASITLFSRKQDSP